MNRRSFVKSGAASTGFMILPNWVIGKSPSPNGKLRIAQIGVGGRGASHIEGYKSENIVAFCDVDDARAANSYEKYPKVPRFKDYRKMFDKMAGKLDAVSIAIPDHMHYPVALWSLEQGINVYCEKPLVRTIWEARELKKVAAKAGVITQMGNQGHTHEGLRYIKEWTSAGVIGDVAEVLHWTNRPIWPQGEIKRQNLTVPTTLDYDLWLGVAPKKSFDDRIVPFAWRGWKDYGCGAVGDMACHIMDSSFSGLDLGIPVEVEAKASGCHEETFPMASTINFTFADRKGKRAPKVTWYDGDRVPDVSKIKGLEADFFAVDEDSRGRKRQKNPNGTFIIGTKGTIWTDTYSSSIRVYPDGFFQEVKSSGSLPPKTLDRVKGGPFKEFIDSIKAGKKAGSDFSYAADFTETALLGLVAIQAGTRIKYNANKMRITNNKEANKYLTSEYDYRSSFIPS